MVHLPVVFFATPQLSTKRYFSNTMAKRNFFFSLPLKMIKQKDPEKKKDGDGDENEKQEISKIFSSLKSF